jgi:hypothetical protein
MSVRVVEGLGEAARKTAQSMAAGSVVVVEEQRSRSTRTFAGVSSAVGIAEGDIEVAVGGVLLASRQETCCGALPRLHLPAASSRSCAYSADV